MDPRNLTYDSTHCRISTALTPLKFYCVGIRRGGGAQLLPPGVRSSNYAPPPNSGWSGPAEPMNMDKTLINFKLY